MAFPRNQQPPLNGLAARLGLGRLLLRVWHQPISRLRDIAAQGGPLVMRATERGRAEMEHAAENLPPLPEFPDPQRVTLHLVTGRRFWSQTAFCLHSFSAQAQVGLNVELYDDGTMNSALQRRIREFAPRARIHLQSNLVARLHEHLPETKFPALRERWRNYPNIRKLVDPHLGSTGWKLAIDSDLLFFRRPDFLLDWLRAPDRPLHAVDCEESYGYPRGVLEKLAGGPIPPLVNVGLTGLRSENLDWEELERWCHELTIERRPSYYLEQALIAILASRQPCTIAPGTDYVTLPRPPEALDCRAVMHHYVAGSKRWYFQQNWRRVIPSA